MQESSNIATDTDFNRLKLDVEMLCAGDHLTPYGEAIIERIIEAEIKYQYEDELSARPYGNGEQIKRELANTYHKSYKTIERIIYRYSDY